VAANPATSGIAAANAARWHVPYQVTGSGPDSLLMHLTNTPRAFVLSQWAATEPGLHDFPQDYHRLQIEAWLWKQREDLVGKRVIDVGVIIRRDWIGTGYQTLGEQGCDIVGDLQAMPMAKQSLEAIICTEVLEHATDPMLAVREMHRCLKPGGVLLASAPFLWVWHGTADYHDYWRFTHEGWARLMAPFASVEIRTLRWTNEGRAAADIIRRFEGMGFEGSVMATTGYVVRGLKG